MPLAEFLWWHHTGGKKFDTPEARAGLSKILEEECLRIADRDVQHYYKQALREKVRKAFGGNAFQPHQNFKKRGFQQNAAQQDNYSKIRRPSYSKRTVTERALLATLINHPMLCDQFEEEIGALDIKENRLDHIRQNVLSLHHSGEEITPDSLRQSLIEKGFEADLRGLLCDAVYTHAGFARPQTEFELCRKDGKRQWLF